jgi:phage shock protein PspC (stress-responsive transcriptional regulator)
MKPTYKASIGGYAFTLEEDAYQQLESYLDLLKKHFEGNPECSEIIADIEFRMSELLQLRLDKDHQVVSVSDAQEIINIMGNPKDFGDSNETESSTDNNTQFNTGEKNSTNIKKGLYRDPNGAIIGGVFSGLGHYLRIDSVLLRVIYVILFLIAMNLSGKVAFFFILFYVVMWIITPKAKTFYQRLSMTGTNPSIENIEGRGNTPVQYRGSGIRTIFRVIVSIICGFIALITLIQIVAFIVGVIWLNMDSQPFTLNESLSLIGFDTLDFKISTALLLLLPLVGILYFSIKGMIWARLTISDLVISLIAIFVLIGSGLYFATSIHSIVRTTQHSERVSEAIPIQTSSDTIYIELDDKYLVARPIGPLHLHAEIGNIYDDGMYTLREGNTRSLFQTPDVRIHKDSIINSLKIEVEKRAQEETSFLAKQKASQMHLDYIIRDSVIIVSPKLYNKNNPFDFGRFNIIVNAPMNKTIIVKDPLR